MNPKKHKLFLTVISCVLLTAVSFSVFALSSRREPEISSGKFENLIADRIELTIENTQFTLKKTSDSAEYFTLTFYITAKKTQGDFYALINSFLISDIAYDNIVFTALTSAAEEKTMNGLLLGSANGEPDVYKWRVDMTLGILGKGEYNPIIKIDYTSGITEAAAQRKLMEIPLTITVE